MASGAYRNGVHKGASAPNFKSSSFKSKHPPAAAPGSGFRRSSSASPGTGSGSVKDDGGGTFRAISSLLFDALKLEASADVFKADVEMRRLGSIRLRFRLFTSIRFVCFCKGSHRLLGFLFVLAIIHVCADHTM